MGCQGNCRETIFVAQLLHNYPHRGGTFERRKEQPSLVGERRFGRHFKSSIWSWGELRVKNCRETVGSQFLPRGILMPRRAFWERGVSKRWIWRMTAASFLGPPKREQGYKKRNDGTKNRNEGAKKRHDGTKNRNEGTKTSTMVPKTGTRVHSPKPALYKTALFNCVIQNFIGRGFWPTQEPGSITILAVNSDHGLSFAGEETRPMVWVSFFSTDLQYFWTLAVQLPCQPIPLNLRGDNFTP